MKSIRTLFTLALAIVSLTAMAQAEKGSAVKFNPQTRYSQIVINSRLNDFYANTKPTGFGQFDDKGNMLQSENPGMTKLDYVPGLVAKAVIEAVDYYKDSKEVNVKPWFYAVQYYGNKYDIAPAGKNGMSFDDLNAVKLYFKLRQLAANGTFADGKLYTNAATVKVANERFADTNTGMKLANQTYAIPASLLAGAAGGWWHKAGYVNQMWCDGQYMGPALLAQMLNEYADYKSMTANDWDMVIKQFSISWRYLWNEDTRLLYHCFTADPKDNASKDWAGISNVKGKEIYHSAEYWGRAAGWYFLALVDVLEEMQKAGMTDTENYKTMRTYLNKVADGLKAKQDAATGCWYQLLNHDGSFVAQTYNQSYRYTDVPVANYLESSATAIFIAAYLKGQRLGLYDADYSDVAKKAYEGFVNQFMKADGNGGVHLVNCCKSAGLGGANYRDGSAEYYLLGRDTQPTSADPASPHFYTEGKVLGAFIIAATEYERAFIDGKATAIDAPCSKAKACQDQHYAINGQRLSSHPHCLHICNGKKVINY